MASPHSKHKRTRDTRRAQASLRAQDERIVSQSQKVRDEQARLDARIRYEKAVAEAQAAEVALRRAEQAEKAAAEKRLREAVATFEREQWREKRREDWPLGAARRLYREGYTLEHCVAFTGWDAEWFEGALDVQRILDES